MKRSDAKAAVKSQETPTVRADHHTTGVAKGKSNGRAKAPAEKREDRHPTFAEMAELERDESAWAAIFEPTSKRTKST